ncbi:response regulator transcription factor [Cellulomonas hominis]|uniref:response regulator n=1 Tax=Cellulomonas hominis TaxID=156981 RepID=UPI001C103393|nr:response regulator transcription factor [Cellulomonas hominis]MBU5421774.1 response regulator transcription factor [Cellulomonas hominis]
MIRVLVVDDEPLFLAGVRSLVEAADDMEVVGTAGDGRQGVAAVRAHRPDVVLLDVQMPVMNGVAATEEILRVAPSTAVIVLTNFQYDRYVLPALRAGAVGYLLKDTTVEDLHRAIRTAAAGEAILSPAVTRRLLRAVRPALGAEHDEARAQVAALSAREREVLAGLARGLTNAEIAAQLYMGETTVKTYLTRAMHKLGVGNRTQAAILAHDAGLDG